MNLHDIGSFVNINMMYVNRQVMYNFFQTSMKMISVNGLQYGILGVMGKGGSSK